MPSSYPSALTVHHRCALLDESDGEVTLLDWSPVTYPLRRRVMARMTMDEWDGAKQWVALFLERRMRDVKRRSRKLVLPAYIDHLLGKELAVLMWGLAHPINDVRGIAYTRCLALSPEERCGMYALGQDAGWRRAIALGLRSEA